MIKYLLLTSVAFFCVALGETTLFAQVADPDPISLTYTYTDTVSGSKEELYNKALKWLEITYNAPKRDWQLKDKNAGILSMRGACFFREKSNIAYTTFFISFQVTINIKDNELTLALTDVKNEYYHLGESHMSETTKINQPLARKNRPVRMSVEGWDKYLKDFENGINDTNKELIKYINKRPK